MAGYCLYEQSDINRGTALKSPHHRQGDTSLSSFVKLGTVFSEALAHTFLTGGG